MSEISQKNIDEYGILPVLWILVCNHEIPFLLYSSAKIRLNLPKAFDLKKLVKKHGELFLQNCSPSDLEIWKTEMLNGKNLPIGIKEIKDDNEKKTKITLLKPSDIFSFQFRSDLNAPPSDLKIIDWGLEYIEKIRKAELEKRNTNLNLFKERVIPLSTTLVALVALLTSYWIQSASIESQEILKKYELDSQEKLKKYEISFNQRNESYVLIMKSFELVTESVESGNKINFQTNLAQLESSYYKIRPFLTMEAQYNFSRTLKDFSSYMKELFNEGASKNFPVRDEVRYKVFKNYFEETLYKDLSERSDYVNTPVTSTVK